MGFPIIDILSHKKLKKISFILYLLTQLSNSSMNSQTSFKSELLSRVDEYVDLGEKIKTIELCINVYKKRLTDNGVGFPPDDILASENNQLLQKIQYADKERERWKNRAHELVAKLRALTNSETRFQTDVTFQHQLDTMKQDYEEEKKDKEDIQADIKILEERIKLSENLLRIAREATESSKDKLERLAKERENIIKSGQLNCTTDDVQ